MLRTIKQMVAPNEEDFHKAKKLAEELRRTLPREFTLTSSSGGYPDLHFVADPEVPGRFVAEVDPDFIMGRITLAELNAKERK